MDMPIAELKQIVRDVLGSVASQMLLNRVDSALDEGAKDEASLLQACTRVERMANLFIGKDKAELIGKRFRDALEKSGLKAA
jgi:hypothetical protein